MVGLAKAPATESASATATETQCRDVITDFAPLTYADFELLPPKSSVGCIGCVPDVKSACPFLQHVNNEEIHTKLAPRGSSHGCSTWIRTMS